MYLVFRLYELVDKPARSAQGYVKAPASEEWAFFESAQKIDELFKAHSYHLVGLRQLTRLSFDTFVWSVRMEISISSY